MPAPSYADLQRELTEAREQQTATSEILRVISRSPTSLEPIAQPIADSAGRLCSCAYSAVFRFDGELIHANMSHELRTPLNAIIGLSEVLTDRMFGELNEEQEEYLKDIYASRSTVTTVIYLRTDKPPFNDVRVRRAISHAVDRPAIIESVLVRGEPTPAVARGLAEWSLPIDQLGSGAQYYRHDPKEAKRLLAEAGCPQGLKTQLTTTSGLGIDLVDAVQLAQRQLKESGIETELKVQEFGAYASTAALGKFEGMAMAPFGIAWEPHSPLYGMYMPEQPRNSSHVSDPKLIAMLKEQMRTRDVEARRRIVFDIQRYAAEQQYYVYLYSVGVTGSWQPYVKNYAPAALFDYGNRAAALWLDR